MSMDKKVSIVVPLYNMEDLVGKCLDSLVKQTYKNLEIVVVDDGSSDNSGKIADEYAAKYPQIAVLWNYQWSEKSYRRICDTCG